MTVRIVTDSSCDLPEDVAERLGIIIVPLSIRFGDEEFVDREELSTDDFWAKCAVSDLLPETAAPSPGRFEQAFRKAAAEGATSIISINLSADLSATRRRR
jgi:DegV family protein with EDD domain